MNAVDDAGDCVLVMLMLLAVLVDGWRVVREYEKKVRQCTEHNLCTRFVLLALYI